MHSEDIQFIRELLLVFFVSGLSVFLFQRWKVPSVVGLLVAGIIVGPSVLKLIDGDRVHVLAEIGVVVLLFTVGLEFSLTRLVAMAPIMAQVGLPQLALSLGGTFLLTWGYFHSANAAIFAGMLVAMSSTAIVIKLLFDRDELGTPAAKIAVAVLLFQDLLVVLFVLLVPILANDAAPGQSLWVALGWGLAVIAGIIVAGQTIVPAVLYQIVRTRNRELFLISIFVCCIGTAALTAWVGLSLALGAFLAGLMLAESEYGHQTLAEVLPFRDTLSSLFFVSVGMLLDLQFVATHAVQVAVIVAVLVLLKTVAVSGPALVFGYSVATSVLAGLATAQVGEFSFVLAQTGFSLKLIDKEVYQTFLAAAVLTMSLTPLLMAVGPRFVQWLERYSWVAARQERLSKTEREDSGAGLSDHVIIAGYGFNGRTLVKTLRELNIPYIVLEMNPDTVRRERANGEKIVFGDCGKPAVLEHLGIHDARAYVIGISDPASSRRTVQLARQLNPNLQIIVRTRYRLEVTDLRALGADEVVSEEFETSLEIYARVLRTYQIPGNLIARFVEQVRSEHYDVFRGTLGRHRLHLPDAVGGSLEMETCLITPGCDGRGRTIGELNLRSQTGAAILAIRRQEELLTNPGADFLLAPEDLVILVGSHQAVLDAMRLLQSSSRSADPEPVA